MKNPERFSYLYIWIGAHTQNMNPDTVNARISAQLQISAHLELAPLLRLKICEKSSLLNKCPPPSPRVRKK